MLCAEGRSFCAGADFSKRMDTGTVNEGESRSGAGQHLYKGKPPVPAPHRKPIVGFARGAAVGGGLGLAGAGFSGSPVRGAVQLVVGWASIHGFGSPLRCRVAGGAQQQALLFYTGRRAR